MPKIFKLDIAKIVYGAIKTAGGVVKGTLVKQVNSPRNPLDLTAGPQVTEEIYTFEGFVEEKIIILDDGITGHTKSMLSILGASLPTGIVPQINDKVIYLSKVYKLTKLLELDPAEALYTFEIN